MGELLQYNIKVKDFGKLKEVRTYKIPICKGVTAPYRRKRNEPYTNIAKAIKRARESLQASVSRTKQKIYDYAKANSDEFVYFVTLTFNPSKVDSYDYSLVTFKMTNWLRNIRKKIPSLKYIGVPEKHKSGRYHFHFLMNDISAILMDSGHKTKDGMSIYNLEAYKLGFSTATLIQDRERVSNYLCKYITKDLALQTKGKKRYWHSRSLNLPKESLDLMPGIDDIILSLENEASYHKKIVKGIQEVNIFEHKSKDIE
jgi:hypothetical protein